MSHTLDLPNANSSTDFEFIRFSMNNKSVVVSKDSDFLDYYLVKKEPYKLLWISIGNISNNDLLEIFDRNFLEMKDLIEENSLIELSRESLIVHL
jgi:predicted nuclease of predicted toxin-antitoxin system